MRVKQWMSFNLMTSMLLTHCRQPACEDCGVGIFIHHALLWYTADLLFAFFFEHFIFCENVLQIESSLNKCSPEKKAFKDVDIIACNSSLTELNMGQETAQEMSLLRQSNIVDKEFQQKMLCAKLEVILINDSNVFILAHPPGHCRFTTSDSHMLKRDLIVYSCVQCSSYFFSFMRLIIQLRYK